MLEVEPNMKLLAGVAMIAFALWQMIGGRDGMYRLWTGHPRPVTTPDTPPAGVAAYLAAIADAAPDAPAEIRWRYAVAELDVSDVAEFEAIRGATDKQTLQPEPTA